MNKFLKILLISIFLVLLISPSTKAENWEKVEGSGFNNKRNDYAWSMETFKGKLYVGTLNLRGGGEIWCSNSGEQGTWQCVYDSRFSRNMGIRSLYNDEDQALYACTSNKQGAQILRTIDGQNWSTVVRRGFNNRKNITIRCMVRFEEYLYAGVGGDVARLYRSKNGLNWEIVNDESSFESTKVPNPQRGTLITNNIMIGELAVFNDQLYAFTWTKDVNYRSLRWLINRNIQESIQYKRYHSKRNQDPAQKSEASFLPSTTGAFEVWRSCDGVNWKKVVGQNDAYGNGMGFSDHDLDNMDNDLVTSTAVFQEKLYLGTEHDYGKTSIWRTGEGTQWEKVLDFYELGEKYNYYVWRMFPFNNKLYVGTANLGSADNPEVTGAQIWVSDSGDERTFYNLVRNGFDGEIVTVTSGLNIPKNYGVRSFGDFNDTLFVGTATMIGVPVRKRGRAGNFIVGRDVGCEIWKMTP